MFCSGARTMLSWVPASPAARTPRTVHATPLFRTRVHGKPKPARRVAT
jgi:hypothetical protein